MHRNILEKIFFQKIFLTKYICLRSRPVDPDVVCPLVRLLVLNDPNDPMTGSFVDD